jgi:hypothetical protein
MEGSRRSAKAGTRINTLHLVGGTAFMLVNFGLAGWGYVLYRKGRPAVPPTYWTWLRISAGLFAFEVLTGLLLLLTGYRFPTWLHAMYAGLILLAVGAQEMLRPGANLRRVLTESAPSFSEPYWFAILALANAVFALRQVMTGVLGF